MTKANKSGWAKKHSNKTENQTTLHQDDEQNIVILKSQNRRRKNKKEKEKSNLDRNNLIKLKDEKVEQRVILGKNDPKPHFP